MFLKECRLLTRSYCVHGYLSMSEKPKWEFSYYHQIGNKVIALLLLGKTNKFHKWWLQSYRKMSYIPLTEYSDRQKCYVYKFSHHSHAFILSEFIVIKAEVIKHEHKSSFSPPCMNFNGLFIRLIFRIHIFHACCIWFDNIAEYWFLCTLLQGIRAQLLDRPLSCC